VETILFEYDGARLEDADRFSLEPALALTRGTFATLPDSRLWVPSATPGPMPGAAVLCSVPNAVSTTAKVVPFARLQRATICSASPTRRGLAHSDSAAAAKKPSKPIRAGVPALIELGRLLQITERILQDEETDEDLQLIFAPGCSLGGARPKVSVIDQHGHLSIAEFPQETDGYSMETCEQIALRARP